MRCSQLMEREILTCADTDTVFYVAQMMRDRGIGFVPVCDMSGRMIGAVTDRDLATRALAAGLPGTTAVREVMTVGAVTCRSDEELEVAERLMAQHQKGRIVCTTDGRPVGVISLTDIFEVEPAERAARVLRSIASRETMFLLT